MRKRLNKKHLTISLVVIMLCALIGVSSYLLMNNDMNNSEEGDKQETLKIDVDFTNLHALIKWNKIEGYDKYEVVRKISANDDFKIIADITADDKTEIEYKDVYYDSFQTDKEKKVLAAKYFLDPSVNGVIYSVKPYKLDKGEKIYSTYPSEEQFHLETPAIVSATKETLDEYTIEWGTVKNANKYYIYSGYKDEKNKLHWHKLDEINDNGNVRMKRKVQLFSNDYFLTVKAVAIKNNKVVYSNYDKGFSIENRKYEDKNILFFGDSITFGSPYKGRLTRDVFSYPYRVQQLTGAKFYNPSIPGSTYTYSEKNNRSRMINIAECLESKRNVNSNDLTKKSDTYVFQTDFVDNQINGRTFSDFDVVIMAAGTNDYLDDAVFGDLDSKNIKEMNGSLNKILGYINDASKIRSKKGKSAIKVVFVDLFYSDRTYDYSQRTNRFVTKNKIGLTLSDYQNNIDKLVKKYQSEGMEIYQFETKNLINEKNCPYVASDNLHMTRYLYTQIGNSLSEYLIKNKII